MKTIVAVCAVCIFGVSALVSQGLTQFEVASIKVHSSASPDTNRPVIAGNQFSRTGNVNQLLMYAYELKAYQLAGGPDWVTHPSTDGDYYEIEAVAGGPEPLTQPRARQMLQNLLAERFHLRSHRETKEIPVYALVVGKDGPKFKESAPDAVTQSRGKVTATTVQSSFTKTHMDDVVRVLSSAMDRPVLDRTGLTGFYDLTLEFARDPAAAVAESNAASIFTAVQEQLGLKLESSKGPIEMFVINGVDRPSAN